MMTTPSLRHRALVPLAGLLGLAVTFGLFAAPTLTATAQEEKTIFLSVVDKDGNSVKDMRTEEVLIREDNQDREVVSVKLSTQPLAVVILADTSKESGATPMMRASSPTSSGEFIRDIRVSIAAFATDILAANPESQVELMEFGQAAITVTKMTSDISDFEKGVANLFPKRAAASVLLEAIIEATRSLTKVKTPRRSIVSLNVEPGDEQSRQNIRQLNDGLHESRANLWAVSVQVGSLRNPMRGPVLDVLTKNTGGRMEFVQTPAALETMMKTFADNLNSQYEVTYRRPVGAQAQYVLVGVRRENLGLHASIFAPK